MKRLLLLLLTLFAINSMAQRETYYPQRADDNGFFEMSKHCRFGNCTHTHEPGCAVRDALEKQLIAPSRYTSYLSMLEDKDEAKYR